MALENAKKRLNKKEKAFGADSKEVGQALIQLCELYIEQKKYHCT